MGKYRYGSRYDPATIKAARERKRKKTLDRAKNLIKEGKLCPGSYAKPRNPPAYWSNTKRACPRCHKQIGFDSWSTFNRHGYKIGDQILDPVYECSECGEFSSFYPNDFICKACRDSR